MSLRRQGAVLEWQIQSQPDVDQCLGEVIDQGMVVERCRRNAKALGSPGDGRKVDRLDVDTVLAQQEVGGRLAFLRIAHDDGDDVGIGWLTGSAAALNTDFTRAAPS